MIALLSIAAALASDPPARPEPPAPVPSECPAVVALEPGRPLPAGLVDAKGIALCSAVIVPTSEYADLRATDVYADHVAERYQLDTGRLELDLAYSRDRIKVLETPPPWYARPETQRWAGRIETIVTVAVIGGLLVGLDRASE